MFPRVLVPLLLAACAGPSVHRTPSTAEAEATRVAVATTLGPADPLAAPNCGLPTAAGACTDVTPPSEQQDEHHHHHGGAAPQTPAPTGPPPEAPAAPPPAEPKKEEHHHHHPPPSSATPVNAAPESSEVASVKDPVCGMTINPETAKGGTLTLRGTQHWFCSSSCRRTFLTQNPGAK